MSGFIVFLPRLETWKSSETGTTRYVSFSCRASDVVDATLQNSIIVLPSTHTSFHLQKTYKKHGTLFHVGEQASPSYTRVNFPAYIYMVAMAAEEKPMKLIIKALPGIKAFIATKLEANTNGDPQR